MTFIADFLNGFIGVAQEFLNGLSYVLFVIVSTILNLSDFDPFDELIDQYSPQALIGSEFSDAWSFACGWLPVREALVMVAAYFGIMALCVAFRLMYNWIRFGSAGSGNGGE